MHQFDKKLNKMHKDIEFVLHTCQEGKLTYLGAQVAIRDNKIITSIYKYGRAFEL